MSFSSLPLSYCANVHPGERWADILGALKHHVASVASLRRCPLGAGLWMTASALEECVREPDAISTLRAELAHANAVAYTMNAFPFGDFHAERVKENVYRPDWNDRRRLDYTLKAAELLAQLLPDGAEGSLSTLPLAFKAHQQEPRSFAPFLELLIEAALGLATLERRTGKTIRLAIEPEPLCLVETTPETIALFRELRDRARNASEKKAIDRHVGVCFDVCHQAVEYEDVAHSVRALDEAGIRINKVHVTCALELSDPSDVSARAELARFVEPRYLHQTFANRSGAILSTVDLESAFVLDPPEHWRTASSWRTHFHVPVHQERIGSLRTTRRELREALTAVHLLSYEPHLEVETYTWSVLPASNERPSSLVEGLAAELDATERLLAEIASPLSVSGEAPSKKETS